MRLAMIGLGKKVGSIYVQRAGSAMQEQACRDISVEDLLRIASALVECRYCTIAVVNMVETMAKMNSDTIISTKVTPLSPRAIRCATARIRSFPLVVPLIATPH